MKCSRGDAEMCSHACRSVTACWRKLVDAAGSPSAVGCVVMRLAGLGYDEIGQLFSPPITRQAVEKHLRRARRTMRGLGWRGVILYEAEQFVQVDKSQNGKGRS